MNIDSPISEDQPFSEDEIDALVRAALSADGRAVDVLRMQAEIQARLATAVNAFSESMGDAPGTLPLVPRKGKLGRVVRWTVGLAACLAVAIGFVEWLSFSAMPASAYELVVSAHSELTRSADRCYQVELKLPKGGMTKSSFLHTSEQILVWTRGDRFRFAMWKDGEQLIWGQDAQKRVWIAYNDEQGLQFEKKELPLTLALILSYMSLDFELLSLEILENFDLKTVADPDSDPNLVTVLAKAKPDRKSLHFQEARLEIDRTTKVIRKMELTRTVRKSVNAQATFTLQSEDPQPDSSYTLEGNLPPDAPVYGKDKAMQRAKSFRKIQL